MAQPVWNQQLNLWVNPDTGQVWDEQQRMWISPGAGAGYDNYVAPPEQPTTRVPQYSMIMGGNNTQANPGTSVLNPNNLAPGASPIAPGESHQQTVSRNLGQIFGGNTTPSVVTSSGDTSTYANAAPDNPAWDKPTVQALSSGGNVNAAPSAPNPNQGAEQFPEGIRAWAMAYKGEHGYFPGQAQPDGMGTTPYAPNQMRPMSRASMMPEQFTEYGDVRPWYSMANQAMQSQSPDFRAGTSVDSYAADLANKAWGNQFYDLNGRAPNQDEWVWNYYNNQGQDPSWLNR